MKKRLNPLLNRALPAVMLTVATLFSHVSSAANLGDELKQVNIRDANDKAATIPFLGQKVLAIFYTDPDVSDQNDHFADVLHAANLPKDKYQGIGIANLKDAPWTPNFVIRAIIRRKIEKYNSTILTDPSLSLAQAWKLGDCNDKSLVLIVGKDQKVHYIKKGAMTEQESQATLAKVKELIAQQ